MQCRVCRAQNAENADSCRLCGAPLFVRCEGCGRIVPAMNARCDQCGSLTPEVSAAPRPDIDSRSWIGHPAVLAGALILICLTAYFMIGSIGSGGKPASGKGNGGSGGSGGSEEPQSMVEQALDFATRQKCMAGMHMLRTGAEIYLSENSDVNALSVRAVAQQLPEEPQCPSGGTYTITLSTDGDYRPQVACSRHGALSSANATPPPFVAP